MAANYEDFTDQLNDRDDRVRRLEVEGTKWTIECHDPYGFWKVRRHGGGPLPEILSGQYTGFPMAERDIRSYMSALKKVGEDKAGRIEAAIYKPTRYSKLKAAKEETQLEG